MNFRRRFLTLAPGLLGVVPAAVADEGAVPAGCGQADGKLTPVQSGGPTAMTFDPGRTGPCGLGALRLAGSEILRLAPQ